MTPASTITVPVLAVRDLMRAVAWYERLGFVTVATFDAYAILVVDGAEVHLIAMDHLPSPEHATGGAYLRVADADAVFERWTAMGAPALSPPTDQSYGVREFATEDLDGNLWRVGHRLATDEVRDPGDEVAPALDRPDRSRPTNEDERSPRGEAPPADVARRDGGPGTGLDAWLALVDSAATCAGCGLAPGELPARALGAQILDEVHAFGLLLADADDDALRRRSASGGWSALEYAVHVRDLLVVFAERIVRTLAEEGPELGWWDHEAAIADGMANESFVDAVVDDLGRNASKLSESLRLVNDSDWDRTATRRTGERFTIELMARFALHEVVHHHGDAQAALHAARNAGRFS